MKTLMMLLMSCAFAIAQTSTEKIVREFTLPNTTAATLMVFSINGDVKVEGYTGDKVLVEVEKTIVPRTRDRLEQGKEEIQLGALDRLDTLMLYVKGACAGFGKQKDKNGWQRKWNNWGYQWNECRGDNCDKPYDYKLQFTIKLPRRINLLAATVNDGDVTVHNVEGVVVADNINGSIRLTSLAGPTNASTINGDVDLDYALNPSRDSRYYSLNGNINAHFKKGLSADLAFESFNGELFSDIEGIQSLPVSMERASDKKGVKYKVSGSRYRIRQGGILLDFETFNGNVYLKEKAN